MAGQFNPVPVRRYIFRILLFLLIAFKGIILLSPYRNVEGFKSKLIWNTVEIDIPVDSVFHFLGNSSNAKRWSVFVNHIQPLNVDSFPDGTPGSRRRCFCNANQKGRQWDELITMVIPDSKRQLTIYNLIDFPFTANNLATEQLYEQLEDNRCRLTFTVFFKDIRPGFWDSLKMYFAAYKIKSIFKENMLNIKRITETGY